MRVIGFNFDKISIERKANNKEGMKIGTSIDILQVDKTKTDIIKIKEEIIGLKFKYNVDYSPDIAKIELEGSIILTIESDIAKEVFKMWKDKKLPEDFRISALNLIYRKSNIRAIQLEDEMNLPLHIPLPVLSKQEDKK